MSSLDFDQMSNIMEKKKAVPFSIRLQSPALGVDTRLDFEIQPMAYMGALGGIRTCVDNLRICLKSDSRNPSSEVPELDEAHTLQLNAFETQVVRSFNQWGKLVDAWKATAKLRIDELHKQVAHLQRKELRRRELRSLQSEGLCPCQEHSRAHSASGRLVDCGTRWQSRSPSASLAGSATRTPATRFWDRAPSPRQSPAARPAATSEFAPVCVAAADSRQPKHSPRGPSAKRALSGRAAPRAAGSGDEADAKTDGKRGRCSSCSKRPATAPEALPRFFPRISEEGSSSLSASGEPGAWVGQRNGGEASYTMAALGEEEDSSAAPPRDTYDSIRSPATTSGRGRAETYDSNRSPATTSGRERSATYDTYDSNRSRATPSWRQGAVTYDTYDSIMSAATTPGRKERAVTCETCDKIKSPATSSSSETGQPKKKTLWQKVLGSVAGKKSRVVGEQ